MWHWKIKLAFTQRKSEVTILYDDDSSHDKKLMVLWMLQNLTNDKDPSTYIFKSVSESNYIWYCNVNDKKKLMQELKSSFYMLDIN